MRFFCAGLLLLVHAVPARSDEAAANHEHHEHHDCAARVIAPPPRERTWADESAAPLPPLPDGVTELKFAEFYKTPVGLRGLEPTDKLRRLAGRKVRLLGYMVRTDRPVEGRLILAPFPQNLHEHEYGLVDDLPPQIVFVTVPDQAGKVVPFTPGLLLLTGTLELGNRLEPDGRVSHVRLVLDAPVVATHLTDANQKGNPQGETQTCTHPN